MPKLKTRREFRSRRHKRVRNKIVGTSERPRLCVFRSNNNIYASLIDDTVGKTLFSLSTLNSELKVKLNSSTGN
ncbi:50S ribosomal protein L18, partial [bacterium]|nr:50S ribosomal protein L18 [bacterium]